MTNRFLLTEREPVRPDRRMFPGVRTRMALAQKKKDKCQQFSEIEVEPDQFVIDVLHFFFDEKLEPHQLNDPLRELAAKVLYEAKKSSKAMDLVPRTPGWKPSVTWLVSQAVQIAFRREQNKCIYEAVRVTIKRNFRSEFELARMEIMQSVAMAAPAPAAPRMKTSKDGLEFIKRFEGFRAQLYDGPGGHCHIGYGHLVHRGACDGSEPEEFKAGITEARAMQLLAKRAEQSEALIASKVTVPLSQCQFDALVSFCMNVGGGNFSSSTLLKKLNMGDHESVLAELGKWVNAGGKVLKGLQRRRAAEVQLYRDCVYVEKASSLSVEDAEAEATEEHEIEDGPHLATVSLSTPFAAHCERDHAATASTANFELAEFACHDGTPVPEELRGHVQTLMEQLEVLRAELGGKPIKIVSGYRTPAWNQRVKGARYSRHMCAQAADIRVRDHDPATVHATIERLIGEGRMRQGGLGAYKTFTHYDVRGKKARW